MAYKAEFLNQVEITATPEHPNILLIMVDDLGMSDLTLYGGGHPETPNIDKLGKQGVVFNNAYVTSPVCSPSRAAILSGRYPQRFGFQFQLHERYLRNRLEYLGFKYLIPSYPWMPKWMESVPDEVAISQQGIPPHEILLSELLKKHGYENAIIGKWHLGADALRTPCQFGFDYQFGFYASHSLYAHENSPGIHDQKVDQDFTDVHIWNGQRDGAHAIYQNCEEIIVKEYLTDRFADEAIAYLDAERSHPFFLYLSFNAPHTPLQAPMEYLEKFMHIQDPIKRTYYAMIANLDDNIGRVVETMDNHGLLENTIIFFISDNGGAEYTLTTDNGKYKGGKITNLEGGLKVPFFIYWKNHLSSGSYDAMVSSMDIFQTIIELVDVKLPDDRLYDGINLVPFILGEKESNPHEYLYWQRGFSKAIRNNEWKLSINGESQDSVLFHISSDPYEAFDLFENNKEIARQLARAHEEWSWQLPPPLWPSMIYYHFQDGDKRYYFDQ
jgi:arylsulfatase A-like enzyme